jgi:hypothetical protein
VWRAKRALSVAVVALVSASCGGVSAGDSPAEPPRFPERDGWHVGGGGGISGGDDDLVTAWAATVPYSDAWNALPPFRTLERLPRDGIIVWVGLSSAGDAHAWPPVTPDFELSALGRHAFWEGQVRDIPEHRLWGTLADDTHIDLRVFFGRPDPTPEMRAEAQAVLDELELPG